MIACMEIPNPKSQAPNPNRDLGLGMVGDLGFGFAMRLIVGITGATGVIYGVRLLQRLREAGVETHLVISRWGARTLLHETPYSREQVEALATEVVRARRHGRGDRERVVPDRRDDHRAVQRQDAGADRARLRRQPRSSRRRRHAEGAAQAGARRSARRRSARFISRTC